jgi:hypothetical protein
MRLIQTVSYTFDFGLWIIDNDMFDEYTSESCNERCINTALLVDTSRKHDMGAPTGILHDNLSSVDSYLVSQNDVEDSTPWHN